MGITVVFILMNKNIAFVCVGHTYESNVIRSAKRVAYFGQVFAEHCKALMLYNL